MNSGPSEEQEQPPEEGSLYHMEGHSFTPNRDPLNTSDNSQRDSKSHPRKYNNLAHGLKGEEADAIYAVLDHLDSYTHEDLVNILNQAIPSSLEELSCRCPQYVHKSPLSSPLVVRSQLELYTSRRFDNITGISFKPFAVVVNSGFRLSNNSLSLAVDALKKQDPPYSTEPLVRLHLPAGESFYIEDHVAKEHFITVEVVDKDITMDQPAVYFAASKFWRRPFEHDDALIAASADDDETSFLSLSQKGQSFRFNARGSHPMDDDATATFTVQDDPTIKSAFWPLYEIQSHGPKGMDLYVYPTDSVYAQEFLSSC